MDAQIIRTKFLEYTKRHGHEVIPAASLVPENDSTTLFTGAGMQPLLPYFLGATHPSGKKVADSQTCLRVEDIDEVGDNRHTTFFEMLGNWSFGDYFKAEQLQWFFDFLVEDIGLNPKQLYVTCFSGDVTAGVQKDETSAQIWQQLFKQKGIDAPIVELGSEAVGYQAGMQDGRIFYYNAAKNWWSRSGKPDEMPVGEPGGPDSEVFYEFSDIQHDPKYGAHCHPNCECGRYLEIGNSVFMEFIKQSDGRFGELPTKNVDFGGGLERITAASRNDPDIFKISLIWPIIEKLEIISGQKYDHNTVAMRVIADHLRATTFLAADRVIPSNKGQGYVMRRLIRRAIRYGLELGIEQNLCQQLIPEVLNVYKNDFKAISDYGDQIITVLSKEEKVFRQTIKKGLKLFELLILNGTGTISGADIFKLYDTYGFPVELSEEEAAKRKLQIATDAKSDFERLMAEQRERSRTATVGEFKGGLADNSETTTKLHTAAHLLDAALHQVLGDHIEQRGSNINAERLRFDFSHPEKIKPSEITEIERIVNQAITDNLTVSLSEEVTQQALNSGAIGAFGHKYGNKVKVYTIGDPKMPFSREICGGPHVNHTGQLAEGGKKFKIIKEEASSAGVRRIKAVLS